MIRTVLVVDDSQVDRTHLEKLLASAGYTVTCASTGVEGIEKARNGRPDAILMDINMPEMDGFAATRALRGDASTKDIPVVFVTAKQQKADKAWGQMLGAKGYVTKPYSKDQILEQLKLI
jgi:twitching motility two-component system response regulator PilH